MKQREKLKEIILEQIKDLEREIESLSKQTQPVAPDNSIGRLTRMDAINDKEMREANLRASKLRLGKLESALAKIEEDGFGVCVVCGEEIAEKRLLARPESVTCIECAKLLTS